MSREVTQALVLAAGLGSRLGSTIPKPLLPLLGVPLLARTLFTLKKAGITDAYVVIGHEGERVRREISAIRRLDLRLHWIENPRWAEPNGVSVLAGAPHLDGPFLLTMSDHLLPVQGLARLRAEAARGRELVLLVDKGTSQVHDLSDATKVRLDGERITAIAKELPAFDAIDTGAFLAGPALLEALKALDGEKGPSLSDGVRRLAAEGRAWALDGTGSVWQDVDTPDDVAVAERKLMSAWPKPTDGVISRWINRPISLRVTRLLAPTGVTPNQVSVLTLILGLVASWFAALGGYAWWLAAAVAFQVASILDGTDGELASLTFRQTPFGAWMDTICDNVSYVAFMVGVMVGVDRAGLSASYLWWGGLGFASALLSLVNIQMVLHRDGTSGSALSVRYAHQEGESLVHRLFQAVHAFGKRDLISFVVLVLALFGQLPLGLPILGVGATLFLLPATLQANVSHWIRMRAFTADVAGQG
ncbi:MAG: NTP transferase domain-containing protein [Longimicrobiales bacterium]